MAHNAESLLRKIANLNINKKGDRRAPHKPLLLLTAIAELLKGHSRLSFSDVEEKLTGLLKSYAPPVLGQHQPELPYWHLCNDGLWQVESPSQLQRQKSGFPKMAALRLTVGGLPDDVAELLLSDAQLVQEVVGFLLDEHFPPSVHDDILSSVGLTIDAHSASVDRHMTSDRTRDPEFRKTVLRAYEYRCAFSGFRAALAGTYFGCEAAHIKWHAYGGPDIVSNGISLEPTIHKLFDVGAWSLTDDRRILVSSNYTGSDVAIERLRAHHGQLLRSPLPGEPQVATEFIRWHREPKLGGVFREPSLPL